MPLSTKLFHQYTNGGNFISNDGWMIVPDPLIEDGNNFLRQWRLLDPQGNEISSSASPNGINVHQFDLVVKSYYQLRREEGDHLSIDEIINKHTLH